jgi:hypothetical protein
VPVPEPELNVILTLVLNLKIVVVDEIVGRLITAGSPPISTPVSGYSGLVPFPTAGTHNTGHVDVYAEASGWP